MKSWWHSGLFILMMGLIISVSAIDNYLLIVYQDVILQIEKNPIGRFLIVLNENKVALFSAIKLFGTTAVCAFLAFYYQKHPIMAFLVCMGLATFQGFLLWYLLG